jgi:hypothetical protein
VLVGALCRGMRVVDRALACSAIGPAARSKLSRLSRTQSSDALTPAKLD